MDNTRMMFVFYLVAVFGLLVLVVYFINHRFNNLTLTLNEYRSTLERVVHLGGFEKDLYQMDLSMTMGFSKVNHNSLLARYDQRKGKMEIIK